MPISQQATPGVFSSASELIALVLLTFRLPGYPDLRVVNNAVDITSRGQLFEAVGFKITLINQDSEKLPTVTLQIDNLDPRIIEYIRSLPEAPRMMLEVVTSADNFQSPEQSIDFLRLTSVNYNALVITAQLVLDNYLGARFPGGDYTPSEFPALFGIAGAGSYAYGNPTRGSATLYDAPMSLTTGLSDISDYRRKVRTYGTAAVVASPRGGALRCGESGGVKSYMITYGVYAPKTELIIELDVNLPTSVTAVNGGLIGVFETRLVRSTDGRSNPFECKLEKVESDIGWEVVVCGSLRAPFSKGTTHTINVRFKNGLVSATIDSLVLKTVAGAESIELGNGGYAQGNVPRAVAIAWGFTASANAVPEWVGDYSRLRVTSSDPAAVSRALIGSPTSSVVKLLLKCNDVTGGHRFTDSGYNNMGDLEVVAGGPTIQRSGLALFDGYGYGPSSDEQSALPRIRATSNLNYGPYEGDFCYEFYAAPLERKADDSYYLNVSTTVGGSILVPGYTGDNPFFGFSTSGAFDMQAVPDVVGAPNDVCNRFSQLSIARVMLKTESGVPTYVREDARGFSPLSPFGHNFIHYAIFREGNTLSFSVDGLIVDQINLLEYSIGGVKHRAEHAVFGAVGELNYYWRGKLDCLRLTIGHSVYGSKDFIPAFDEFPDATKLPPGAGDDGSGNS